MKRWKVTIAAILGILVLTGGVAAEKKPTESSERSPVVVRAETAFFEALNDGTRTRKSALGALRNAVASQPTDARANLLLGLGYLWSAVEGDRARAETIDSLVLSRYYLERAQAHDPTDGRIPSWLSPVRIALSTIHRNPADGKAAYDDLVRAFEEDPNFHSFSMGLMNFPEPIDSERFATGLAAIRSAVGCVESDDPTCGNLPRWPHNIEGFSLALGDYELKAGEIERARELFENARTLDSYESWALKEEVEHRLSNLEDYSTRWRNDDKTDDPQATMINSRESCRGCHQR